MSAYVEAMFSVTEMPWHHLGVILDNPPSISEAIIKAGLNWKVDAFPIQVIQKNGMIERRLESKEHVGICRLNEQGEVINILGIATTGYGLLQNEEAFEFFQPIVESGLVTLETAGTLKNGKVIWILAKLNNDIDVGISVKGNADIVKQYLLLSTAHTGKRSVKISFTPIRVVCWNTLSMADRDTGILIPHRKNIKDRITEVKYDFTETLATYDRIGKVFNNLFRIYLRFYNL